MKKIIKINGLTKNYGDGRGIFDINLTVNKGEVFGLVGINGSGKTTLIRHLMGFLKPQKGHTSIMDRESWRYASELKKHVGYIPGEIAFPEVNRGTDFFKLQAEYLGIRDMSRAIDLIQRFNLDADAKLKRMSKGMKQKSAIVSAFMADLDILLLDEGSTGLDPLMQNEFTNLVKEEKQKGKTIFMSSHIFSELESTCDRVAFLKNGHIIDVVDMNTIRGNESVKEFKIEFTKQADFNDFLSRPFYVIRKQPEFNQATILIPDKDINELFGVIQNMDVRFITQKPRTLEAYFKEKYTDAEAV
ncbi:ABC transporter ATP-binding protein [Paenibacillus sp. NPDC057934]|uniref:ABC transporter ATP-binding protein n=1 Tax=Paenibacillus sp. NPDC057934 TaxID=3346282 RepID=UPI0036DE8463